MKIRVLVNVVGADGCNLYRLIFQHAKMEEISDKFEITYGFPKDVDAEQRVLLLKDYDIFIYHRVTSLDLKKAKELNPKLIIICDQDDWWHLNDKHHLKASYTVNGYEKQIQQCIKDADYVTTTTSILEKKILPFNKNTIILPNCVPPVKQNFKESNRIRFGLIGGCSHIQDLELMIGVTKALPKDVLDKVQFVMCGFDKGVKRLVDQNGNKTEQPMPWDENAWTKMEKIFTDDYKLVTDEHKAFLRQYLPGVDDNFDDMYRRIWSRDIWHYMTCYDEVDVLLVPLLDVDFNHCKSELKLIEAAATDKIAIVSDVYPYKLCGINAIEKGGTINPDGNCIMVDNRKGAKGWIKAIQRIIKDKELRDTIKKNIPNVLKQYDFTEITNKRIEFYELAFNKVNQQ